MCKRIYLLGLALFIGSYAGIVLGEEGVDPLKIPWPNCGVGSNTGVPCEDSKHIEKEATWVVDEITQEDLDKLPKLKEKEKPLRDRVPATNQKQGN